MFTFNKLGERRKQRLAQRQIPHITAMKHCQHHQRTAASTARHTG